MIDKNPPLKKIHIDKLVLWKEANVRKTDPYKDLDDLINNIKKLGLKNPLLVKGKNNEGKYLVFSGQRRLMACAEAGLDEIPSLVHEKITVVEARIISLSENLYRLKMNYNDISEAAKLLLEYYHDRKDVAKALGVTENTVKRYIGYDAVPKPIKDLVGKKKITASQALDLYTKFRDQNKSIKIARELARIPKGPSKTKFYYATRGAKPSDSANKIRKIAKKMKPLVRYEIRIPSAQSDIIKRIAHSNMQKPGETIAEIIDKALIAYAKGTLEL